MSQNFARKEPVCAFRSFFRELTWMMLAIGSRRVCRLLLRDVAAGCVHAGIDLDFKVFDGG